MVSNFSNENRNVHFVVKYLKAYLVLTVEIHLVFVK